MGELVSPMSLLHLLAPAKLNLYLRVIGKRADGYHEIETLFERIDLADELTFEPARGALALTTDDPSLPGDEENLIVKAARALQAEAGTNQGARLRLTKRIPIAAGLGGGSSDAATTLIGLNQLWGLRLDRARLAALAAQLGSDVPFFLFEEAFAVGRGRGEVCEPVAAAAPLAQVLVIPRERLSTREIYAGAQLGLTAPKPSITMMQHALRNGSLGELAEGLWNDLEPEAIRRCPVITVIQTRLRHHGVLAARVSGSGSSVFGVCTDLTQAQEVAWRLRVESPPDWRIEVVQTLLERKTALNTV